MPLTRVDLPRALFDDKGPTISREIHQAQIDSLDIPADDRFQLLHPMTMGRSSSTRHPAGRPAKRRRHPDHDGAPRPGGGRTGSVPCDRRPFVQPRPQGEDLQIAIVENSDEDWCAGTLPQ